MIRASEVRQGDVALIDDERVVFMTGPMLSEKFSPGQAHFLVRCDDSVAKLSMPVDTKVDVVRRTAEPSEKTNKGMK